MRPPGASLFRAAGAQYAGIAAAPWQAQHFSCGQHLGLYGPVFAAPSGDTGYKLSGDSGCRTQPGCRPCAEERATVGQRGCCPGRFCGKQFVHALVWQAFSPKPQQLAPAAWAASFPESLLQCQKPAFLLAFVLQTAGRLLCGQAGEPGGASGSALASRKSIQVRTALVWWRLGR